jgi:hypothetical protein
MELYSKTPRPATSQRRGMRKPRPPPPAAHRPLHVGLDTNDVANSCETCGSADARSGMCLNFMSRFARARQHSGDPAPNASRPSAKSSRRVGAFHLQTDR